MKNIQIKYFTLLFALLLLSSCAINPCPTAVKMQESMETLVDQASDRAEKSDKPHWTRMDKTFNKLITECYDLHKAELSLNDKKDFWLNGIRYYKHRYGEDWYERMDDPDDILAQRIEEEIGDSIENSAEDVVEFLKEIYGDEIKEGIDEVVDEIEKLGEELKNILSN